MKPWLLYTYSRSSCAAVGFFRVDFNSVLGLAIRGLFWVAGVFRCSGTINRPVLVVRRWTVLDRAGVAVAGLQKGLLDLGEGWLNPLAVVATFCCMSAGAMAALALVWGTFDEAGAFLALGTVVLAGLLTTELGGFLLKVVDLWLSSETTDLKVDCLDLSCIRVDPWSRGLNLIVWLTLLGACDKILVLPVLFSVLRARDFTGTVSELVDFLEFSVCPGALAAFEVTALGLEITQLLWANCLLAQTRSVLCTVLRASWVSNFPCEACDLACLWRVVRRGLLIAQKGALLAWDDKSCCCVFASCCLTIPLAVLRACAVLNSVFPGIFKSERPQLWACIATSWLETNGALLKMTEVDASFATPWLEANLGFLKTTGVDACFATPWLETNGALLKTPEVDACFAALGLGTVLAIWLWESVETCGNWFSLSLISWENKHKVLIWIQFRVQCYGNIQKILQL